MNYSLKQKEYIDSVEGKAHQSAVRIIGELETELAEARKKPEPGSKIDEAIKLLMDAHDNDLTRIHIEHDNIQHEIKNARWDCAEKIRKALKLLESKPEPGEFTERCRAFIDHFRAFGWTGDRDIDDTEFGRCLREACDIIDRLTAELATLKDELTCEECEKSLVSLDTCVTAICIPCWNAVVTKLRAEIDSLTAELAEARKKPESYIDVIRQIGRIACGDEEIERLTDELKAKDEEIARLKHDIKVISECKIHCKNCNVRIEQALKVKGG